MRKMIWMAAVAVVASAGSVSAQATSSATFEVAAISEVFVSGNPGALIIDDAAELSNGVTDATTTWGVTTNEAGAKVTGKIDLAMPTDVTLSVNLSAPTGASSAGAVALTTTDADLVTAIPEADVDGLTVTYSLSALPSAGAVASDSRTVTFTITGGV